MSKASDIHEAVAACEKEIFNTAGKIIQERIDKLQNETGIYITWVEFKLRDGEEEGEPLTVVESADIQHCLSTFKEEKR